MWTINGIRVFTQKFNETDKQIIARLNPLEGGTIHHVFGYEDPTVKMVGIVVGVDDKNSLKNLYKNGTTVTVSGYNVYGSYYISKLSIVLENTVKQTLRQDLDCTAPVYNVNIELYEEV